jgi:hypothetical protein
MSMPDCAPLTIWTACATRSRALFLQSLLALDETLDRTQEVDSARDPALDRQRLQCDRLSRVRDSCNKEGVFNRNGIVGSGNVIAANKPDNCFGCLPPEMASHVEQGSSPPVLLHFAGTLARDARAGWPNR